MKLPMLILVVCTILIGCEPAVQENLIQGKTMGTTYNVKYVGQPTNHLKGSIDSVLIDLNTSLSTYIDTSNLSSFNTAAAGEPIRIDAHFNRVLKAAKSVHQLSYGAFNPAILPLVRYYGFGNNRQNTPKEIDTNRIAELLKIIDFKSLSIDENGDLIKPSTDFQLDFGAIAKGYGVDLVAELLKSRGYQNFMVEIGGEVSVAGTNKDNQNWRLGIENPSTEVSNQKLTEVVELDNLSMATSGNYRNYKTINGKKVVHTINPKTGLAEENDLLSATVVHPSCMLADGYATACMVLGYNGAVQLSNQLDLMTYFIYADCEGNVQSSCSVQMQGLISKTIQEHENKTCN